MGKKPRLASLMETETDRGSEFENEIKNGM